MVFAFFFCHCILIEQTYKNGLKDQTRIKLVKLCTLTLPLLKSKKKYAICCCVFCIFKKSLEIIDVEKINIFTIDIIFFYKHLF